MTESEWLECTDPRLLLHYLDGKVSERKLRLFGCTCCRRVWNMLRDSSRSAVESIEGIAEGAASERELPTIAAHALAARDDPNNEYGFAPDAVFQFCRSKFACTSSVPQSVAWAKGELIGYGRPGYDALVGGEYSDQTKLLRCIVGNPFHPISINSDWLTPTVTSLAKAAYEERALPSGELDPARLAVLADALEDAGCADAEVLDHLRSPGPHVRGCWAVDLLTAKE